MRNFKPVAPDRSGVVSFAHLGDLHMVRRGEQNFVDLQRIVAELNARFAGQGVSFVYLPGDVADDGSREAYAAVRECLDGLKLPWCAVVGDHDVHERSFANFEEAMGGPLYGAFTVGSVRFLRLNAFAEPRPDAFVVDEAQMQWVETELVGCEAAKLKPVVLMHCYPSDLKQGGERLTELLRRHRVLLVDMGHTHYNELSNDGYVVYSATRSTGQVEEGPVGYSVISIDGEDVSWQFVPVGNGPAVMVTKPVDARLWTERSRTDEADAGRVRARVWSEAEVALVTAQVGEWTADLKRMDGANLWEAALPEDAIPAGVHELVVSVEDVRGTVRRDHVRVVFGGAAMEAAERAERDQENAVGAWPEKGILGTQLGPNKNGRKW